MKITLEIPERLRPWLAGAVETGIFGETEEEVILSLIRGRLEDLCIKGILSFPERGEDGKQTSP